MLVVPESHLTRGHAEPALSRLLASWPETQVIRDIRTETTLRLSEGSVASLHRGDRRWGVCWSRPTPRCDCRLRPGSCPDWADLGIPTGLIHRHLGALTIASFRDTQQEGAGAAFPKPHPPPTPHVPHLKILQEASLPWTTPLQP